MKDESRPSAGKQKAVDSSIPLSATTKEPMLTGVKPKSKHVEFHEPIKKGNYSEKPKRASPAFKFSSEIQESVNHDHLLNKVLDGPANCTLGDILSMFEMSKRMQVITKTQKIPLKTNTGKSKQTSSVTIEEIDNEDVSPVASVCATTAYPPEKPKFPMWKSILMTRTHIFHSKKGPRIITNASSRKNSDAKAEWKVHENL